MHEIGEKGVAAHWAYKQGQKAEGKHYRWIRELLEILEQASNPEEFLENTKLEMYNDQVFCFTPKGDLIGLPINSTPVDFAYAVHSSVGDTCVGAKINGEIRPLRTVLQNGDQVDILTSKAQHPSAASSSRRCRCIKTACPSYWRNRRIIIIRIRSDEKTAFGRFFFTGNLMGGQGRPTLHCHCEPVLTLVWQSVFPLIIKGYGFS